jgi:hypothetical protein
VEIAAKFVFLLAGPLAFADELSLRACVEPAHPVPLSAFADNDPIGATQDVGNITLMEISGDYSRGISAPRQAVAARYLASHPDKYDFLVVFTTFEFDTGVATAFYNPIRNDTTGLGLPTFDLSAAYASAGTLQGYVDMAALGRYTFAVGSPNYHNSVDVLAHEIMHRWGTHVHFIDAVGHDSADLLGQEAAHWSYFLDTDASVMYGNDWQAQGAGFQSVGARHRFSPLDLYLGGFAAASEVPPFTLIRNGTGGTATDLPRLGAVSDGQAETITIEQIIAASGTRVPSVLDTQKNFSAAMILLKRPGENVAPERLLELERFRIRFEQQLIEMTDGRATMRIFTQAPGGSIGPPAILHGSGQTANPGGISGATAWLEQHQFGDGHWEDRPQTAMRDTAAVVVALEELDSGFSGLARARAWMRTRPTANFDQRSWKLLGVGLDEDAAALTSDQDAGGGFALASGWNASSIDTALVAAALADHEPGTPAINAALQWLGTEQNADGSFGVAKSGYGHLLSTLHIASLFGDVSDGSSATHLQQAADWIARRQLPDGGMGLRLHSSLAETIETYSSLGRVQMPPPFSADGVRAYVRHNQQLDGDWGGSIYLTAKAVLAYGRDLRANLAFSSAPTISPMQLHDGERATLAAIVANTGNVAVGATTLRWYDGDPDLGGIQLGGDLLVPDLAAGSRTTITYVWDASGQAGDHVLRAVLDATNAVSEASEQDNRAQIAVTVLPPFASPDLTLIAGDFTLDPLAVSSLPSTIHLSGLIRNIGAQEANGAQVRLFAKPDTTHALATTVVDVPARGSAPLAMDFQATAATNLSLLLRADPEVQPRVFAV